MSSPEYFIREIQPQDNVAVAALIRTVMAEYGATGEGYSINDPEVDAMFEAYDHEKAAFFVVEKNTRVLGCAGIGPLAGGNADTCELKKMYFYSELRGKGLGKEMIKTCLKAARKRNYRICYLETIESMTEANRLYQRSGFKRLNKKLGNTGHSACDICYSLEL